MGWRSSVSRRTHGPTGRKTASVPHQLAASSLLCATGSGRWLDIRADAIVHFTIQTFTIVDVYEGTLMTRRSLKSPPLMIASAGAGIFLALPVMLALTSDPALAEEKTSVVSGLSDSELTPEERTERDARKSCKVDLCRAFRNPGNASGNITCSIPKSWRKSQLDKMVSKAKVSWPWGPVRCNANIDIDRAMLVKAVNEAKYDLKLKTHHVSCTVDREEKEDAKIDIDFAPTVTFEKGKAVKAKINWGQLSAPTLLKGAMWTATATDNTLNVLQSTLVEDINDFVTKKCDEVKDDWSKPAQ